MGDYLFDFQQKFNFEKRQLEASRIKEKYPNRIPIILEKNKDCKTIDDIDKKKFLVPDDLTMGQFQYVVRKRLKKLTQEQGLFFFVENTMPTVTQSLKLIYDSHHHDDGFLYIVFSGENTFG
jgi:GABA(A) receptor-associated protein